MAKEISTKEKSGVPAALDYGEDAGSGFEGTTGKDLSIPFLAVLQSNSPQVEDNDPEGAKAGMLLNTVTRELFDATKGIVFQPCHKERAIVEWVPRNKGGGFVGMHEANSDIYKAAIEENDGSEFGKLHTPEGNELSDTYYVYGLILDENNMSPLGFAVISFSSTKIKPYRDWLTAMYTLRFKPPLFANRARIRTVKQKNEHGTFYNFKIDPFGATWGASLINPTADKELLEEGKSFRKMVTSGMARAAFETERDAGDPSAADGEKAPF